MKWTQAVRIEKSGIAAGTQNADHGGWTPGTDGPVVLFEGLGDLQFRQRTIRRGDDRDKMITSDADLYLKGKPDLHVIAEGARIVVTDRLTKRVWDARVLTINYTSQFIYCQNVVARPVEITTSDEAAVVTTNADETVTP